MDREEEVKKRVLSFYLVSLHFIIIFFSFIPFKQVRGVKVKGCRSEIWSNQMARLLFHSPLVAPLSRNRLVNSIACFLFIPPSPSGSLIAGYYTCRAIEQVSSFDQLFSSCCRPALIRTTKNSLSSFHSFSPSFHTIAHRQLNRIWNENGWNLERRSPTRMMVNISCLFSIFSLHISIENVTFSFSPYISPFGLVIWDFSILRFRIESATKAETTWPFPSNGTTQIQWAIQLISIEKSHEPSPAVLLFFLDFVETIVRKGGRMRFEKVHCYQGTDDDGQKWNTVVPSSWCDDEPIRLDGRRKKSLEEIDGRRRPLSLTTRRVWISKTVVKCFDLCCLVFFITLIALFFGHGRCVGRLHRPSDRPADRFLKPNSTIQLAIQRCAWIVRLSLARLPSATIETIAFY